MLNRITIACLTLAGVIHLLPLPGILGAGQLTRLYGFAAEDPNVGILRILGELERPVQAHCEDCDRVAVGREAEARADVQGTRPPADEQRLPRADAARF